MALFSRRRQRPHVSNPERLRHNSRNALTAAGGRIEKRDSDKIRRLIQPWQRKAFDYYDIIGEINYAAQFYARALAKLRLYPAVLEDDGTLTDDPDETAAAILNRIQDPGGGRSGLLASYGRLMFLAGECYLFVSQDDDGEEQWEMLSTDELVVVNRSTIQRFRAPMLGADEYQMPDNDDDIDPQNLQQGVAYRLWRRHPRFSALADSTMRGVLDVCEELVLLTQAVRARARSRAAGNGILFLSEEFSDPPLEAADDADALEDRFLADLVAAMTAPMVDEGSPSSVVPLIVRGSTEAIKDGVRHLQLVDPMQIYPESGMRNEAIHRIALGIDMPPEILEGMSDANHWTAWQVDENSWAAHLQPVAQQLVDDLTSAYYRPALKLAGVQDYRRRVIAYDASAVINHPDRTKDSQSLYDRRAIGKKALREAHGFVDDDAPTEDERAEMIGVAVRDSSLAWDGIPSVKAGGLEPEPGVVVNPTGEGGTPDTQPIDAASTEPGPPANAPGDVVASANGHRNGNGNGHAMLAERIVGGADLAVLRAREMAGNRVRQRARRDDDLARELEDVRTRDVPRVLGEERVRALGLDPVQLVAGTHELIASALRLYGIKHAGTVDLIAEHVERHAARTLFQERPSPLPPQMLNYLRGVVETAQR